MHRVVRFAAASFAVAMLVAPLAAQKTTQVHPGKGGSPHVRSEWTVDGATISIEYGRPSMKGRTIFGPEGQALHPSGKVWRMGADEATTLKTSRDLMFGMVHMPAGTYTLYSLPMEGSAPDKPAGMLIINKQTGQWGTVYDAKQDLGRVNANVTLAATPVETLTINIVDTPAGATLVMEWARIRAEVPFIVH
ncbi:MAG: DUF2911 domain-containing protein [Acidobacteriota bacterium]|nr:DUF2911 domain-containing protein [Acidobacteriota bacterium]